MILRNLFWQAASKLARDPRVQAKAAEIAEDVYTKAAPRLENASAHVADSMRETAREVDPLEDPIGFARRFKQRLLPPEDGR
jgi:hypothetical protein